MGSKILIPDRRIVSPYRKRRRLTQRNKLWLVGGGADGFTTLKSFDPDGVDEKCTLPNPTGFFERNTPLTISVFFNTEDTIGFTRGLMSTFKVLSGFNTQGWDIFIGADGKINFEVSTESATYFATVVSTLTFDDGNDHHLAVTYDGSTDVPSISMKMYVDTVSIAFGGFIGLSEAGTTDGGGDLLIGARVPGGQFFKGIIGDCFGANVEFTAGEVAEIIDATMERDMTTHSRFSDINSGNGFYVTFEDPDDSVAPGLLTTRLDVGSNGTFNNTEDADLIDKAFSI